MNVAKAHSSGAEILHQAGISGPRREAASLLAFVLEKDPAFLIAHPDHQLSEGEASTFENAIRRRSAHEPFQYITGRQEFWRLEFEVTPDVLIPRPETEILVEAALGILSNIERPSFCEVGVGSGCIAIAILHSVEKATAVGTDVSLAALAVAARNARKHDVASRLELRKGSVFDGIAGPFDLIVSNPPYVPDEQIESLQAEVRDFEPRPALSGGPDGLEIIRRIVLDAPKFLKPGGSLLMEIGFDQSERVRGLFEPAIWATIDFLPDLQGIPRIIMARVADTASQP